MNSVSSPIDLNSDYVDNLRRDRERFVALAFCAADVLFETEADLKISYAAGATVALTCTALEEIVGQPLLDIIAPVDRPLIDELIRGMSSAKRLDPETGYVLLKTIAACLRVNAAPGETVGRFDDNNYGLVHKPDIDIGDLQQRIAFHLKADDPDGKGVDVSAGTVSTDVVDIPDADPVKAVHYSIKRFCEEDNPETAIAGISENPHSQVHATSRKMTNFREIVSASSRRSRLWQNVLASHTGSSMPSPTNQRNSRLNSICSISWRFDRTE